MTWKKQNEQIKVDSTKVAVEGKDKILSVTILDNYQHSKTFSVFIQFINPTAKNVITKSNTTTDSTTKNDSQDT